ncbi:sugar ABC transporter substrate-binding protein [Clostridium uliginosum]|uniref:D-xylose transport system substrate-binding protein n=1 Tax=Clostridium uliginosum TaxID=119641 RepID=A0A1I1JQD2_9CLOT|nr:substrate-binding domain-containing protein [Clostridium uliginosum]SFC50152.1 D-xylose transport system substrate-binding protein [Clostridium uliginosum]
MYLSIPDVFFVPVSYYEEDVLNIKKSVKNSQRKEIVIGVALISQREDRWVREKIAMEEYANKKGVTLKLENAEYDFAKQVEQVDYLISQGIDVLILLPVDESNLNSADMVQKAHEAGIKVISYDALIRNSDVDLYISFNNERVGELQGRFLIEKVPKGIYFIMYGTPDIWFKKGAMKYIQPLADVGNIRIVADKAIKGWDPRLAFNIVKDVLDENKNKIDAILAPNDPIAGVTIQVLKERGLAGKVAVTGQDADLAAVRRIIEGTQSMTVFKDTRELGKTAIDAAIKLANGEPIDITKMVNNGKIDLPSILIAPIAIDKNNIKSVLIDSGYLKESEVYQR